MEIKPVVELWHTWNVRVLVILSLFTQVLLLLLAPCRKQQGGKWFIKITIWLTYLFADWVAVFTIGLILQVGNHTGFLTLWAPFLLLHLGGPDTITSFSLEDNEFWLRHLLGLLLQVGSTLYVIGQSLSENRFLLPSFLILIAGTIKYVERNLSLYLASFDRFGDNGIYGDGSTSSKQSVESRPEKLTWKQMFEYWFLCKPHRMGYSEQGIDDSYLEEGWRYIRNGNLLSRFIIGKEPLNGIIKFLLVGPLISPHRRDLNRICFLRKSSKETLQMIEIELNLLYEALHTKFPLFESKLGKIMRILSLSCIFGASLSFLVSNKHVNSKLLELDVWLTYVLLVGAIIVDFVAIGLVSSSDFHRFQAYWRFEKYLKINKSICSADDQEHDDKKNTVNTCSSSSSSRWSGTVSQLNFSRYYLDEDHTIWWNNFAGFRNLRLTFVDMVAREKYSSCKKLTQDQEWDFIVEQLREKAEQAETVQEGKKLCQRRGEGPILKWLEIDEESDLLLKHRQQDERKLIWSFRDLDYTESFIAWHIATELCFQFGNTEDFVAADDEEKRDYRLISKVISDYMFYLLEIQDPTTANVFIDSGVILEGTLSHAYENLRKYYNTLSDLGERVKEGGRITYSGGQNLYEEGRNVHDGKDVSKSREIFAMGTQFWEHVPYKSVLRCARKIVDELEQEGGTFPWKVMSQVWVEILCYAAINCRSNIHAQQPSRGGQLLTIVWLLMNHLGLGVDFSQDK